MSLGFVRVASKYIALCSCMLLPCQQVLVTVVILTLGCKYSVRMCLNRHHMKQNISLFAEWRRGRQCLTDLRVALDIESRDLFNLNSHK